MAEDAGALLAAVQLAGHRDVDAVYSPLSHDIEATVLRHAIADERGVLRLLRTSWPLILTAVGRLLDRARIPLTHAIMRAVRGAGAAAYEGAVPPRDVLADLTASGLVYRALATDRPSVLGQTGVLLSQGMAAGLPAREIAKRTRQYFSPFFSPRWDEKGRVLLRADREGAITSWPGRAGMASQHPRTIMLTETTAAHGRSQLRIALYNNQLMQYTLSRQHDDPDECSDLAGIYEPRDAPKVPRHPRCRCYYIRVDRPAREDAA